MLVSIIIPLFNREDLIVETLESIRRQSYIKWECIIVDDYSTDNSFNRVEQYIRNDNRFKVQKRPIDRPKGANACRNYGFEIAKGDLINWFDSDDIMHPDFIKQKLKVFENESEIDGIISKTKIFSGDVSNVIGIEKRTFFSEDTLKDFLMLKIAWYMQNVIWRSSFLKNKKLFDELLLAGQDRDFHTRMLLHNPNLKIIDAFLVYYRFHENNITSNIDDINNPQLKLSHLKGISRLINVLDKERELSNDIRLFYFDSMLKYLPYVISDKKELRVLINLLKALSYFNLKIAFNWLKFGLAFLSLRVFGKGGKLLK